jgi:hypothetical protein
MAVDKKIRQAAIAAIESAFAGLTLPGDATLLHPRCGDDVDVAPFYGGPERSTLSDDMIVRNWWALTSFSPEAFRYYLPAFMIWSLAHVDTIEYAPEGTIRALDPGTEEDDLYRFQVSKFALFSDGQVRAVVRFLETVSGHPSLGTLADAALAHHWRNRGCRCGGG